MTDRSIAALHECLELIAEDHDYSRALDPVLFEHARRVAAAHDDERPDLDALGRLGAFYYSRALALDGKSPYDLKAAARAFAQCLIHDDEPMPSGLARFALDHAAEVALQLAAGLTDRLGAGADRVVAAWRRIEAAMPGDHPLRYVVLANLPTVPQAAAVREEAGQAGPSSGSRCGILVEKTSEVVVRPAVARRAQTRSRSSIDRAHSSST
ncbi:hypothetical protein [Spongiactinospora sp. TRM90649]|uniref:hypothetical protein n=1 Tax=Spongiactinospora sp. TRM90649 TaxID=3031114 RepID=UPI0023F73BD7|nr:hypothetical protein [Spongiactinospora sp. TRM90649]MDF5754262.1 hypothetical protein [Spongiactinospora sp. TRM90649]